MGKTSIEWCDFTFNPWIGCTPVSAACDHCYAEALSKRYGWAEWGAGKPRARTAPSNWKKPLAWNAAAAAARRRDRVFCASLADVFDAEVPSAWRLDLFQLIHATPHLDWLLLTKRPKLMADFARAQAWPANAWAGTTIENKKLGAERAHYLTLVPAPVRFWSVEPLLEDLGDLTRLGLRDTVGFSGRAVHWIIVGGESGPHARPMHPAWAQSIRDQCQAAGVAFFFKQWGEWTPGVNVDRQSGTVQSAHWFEDKWTFGRENLARDDGHIDDEPDLYRVGKRAAGRLLDGREWNEFPA